MGSSKASQKETQKCVNYWIFTPTPILSTFFTFLAMALLFNVPAAFSNTEKDALKLFTQLGSKYQPKSLTYEGLGVCTD